MPIKPIALVLGLFALLCLGVDHSVHATPVAARGNARVNPIGLIRGFYYVLSTTTKTTGTPLRLKDLYRTTVSPIDLQDGDFISVTFQGTAKVDLGDPILGGLPPDGLLMFRNRSKGQLGTSPLFFPKARATFNPRTMKLVFASGHGISSGVPRSDNGPVTVTVHRNRGGVLADFAGSQIFVVRTLRGGQIIEGDYP